jgi:hypothetical protein
MHAGALRFGTPRRQQMTLPDRDGFGDVLLPGDDIAVHWDRVCGRLDGTQAAQLLAVTDRNLEAANQTL